MSYYLWEADRRIDRDADASSDVTRLSQCSIRPFAVAAESRGRLMQVCLMTSLRISFVNNQKLSVLFSFLGDHRKRFRNCGFEGAKSTQWVSLSFRASYVLYLSRFSCINSFAQAHHVNWAICRKGNKTSRISPMTISRNEKLQGVSKMVKTGLKAKLHRTALQNKQKELHLLPANPLR